MDLPVSDLSRAQTKEPGREWPDVIRIIAQWTMPNGKRKATQIILSKEEYFGLGNFGAPMNGDNLMQKIERLRRNKPW